MTAVDTNILLYVHDPRDPGKQAAAESLVQSVTDGVLLWQVACEYPAASRKLEPLGYSRSQAWEDISDLRRVWTALLPGWGVLDGAGQLQGRYNFSFWDGIIVAAYLDEGVSRLYSEDFDAYPRVDGLEIVNPFRPPY